MSKDTFTAADTFMAAIIGGFASSATMVFFVLVNPNYDTFKLSPAATHVAGQTIPEYRPPALTNDSP